MRKKPTSMKILITLRVPSMKTPPRSSWPITALAIVDQCRQQVWVGSVQAPRFTVQQLDSCAVTNHKCAFEICGPWGRLILRKNIKICLCDRLYASNICCCCDTLWRPLAYLPPPWRSLCFHLCSFLVCCLSVCLSLSNITEKRLNGFSWNFQCRWDFIQDTIGNIFRMFHLTPSIQDFSPHFFQSNQCL